MPNLLTSGAARCGLFSDDGTPRREVQAPRMRRPDAFDFAVPSRWRFQRPTDHDLTVVVPAYNEEQRLPVSLRILREFLDDWGIDYRILVIDDGSDDRTSECAEGLGWRFTTLGLPCQSGKGAAVRAGMLSASGRVVAFTDADVPYELDALREGYYRIVHGSCHAVLGARNAEGATHRVSRRWLRTTASLVFRQFVRLLVWQRFTDTQCGLKLFSREAAVEVFSRAVVDGFAFDAEAICLSLRLGLSLERIPVVLVNDYGSTLSVTRHALPMLWDLVRVRWRSWQGRYDLETQFAGPAVRETYEDRGILRRSA